jgi:hypothetical protein
MKGERCLMKDYILNKKVLDYSQEAVSGISRKRQEYHIQNNTIWREAFHSAVMELICVYTPDREEMYGDSYSVIALPSDCLTFVFDHDEENHNEQ